MTRKRLKRCGCTHNWREDNTRYNTHKDTFYKLQMYYPKPGSEYCSECQYYPWEIVVRGGKHDKDQD